MALPETVRVKLSSEEAGAISITPVVVREMPVRELIELMLGITGQDAGRVRELLRRGTLISGATRCRWQGFDAEPGEIDEVLGTFPDAQPGRPFDARNCVRVVIHGAGHRIGLTRKAGAKRRFLRRRSFWDRLMEIVSEGSIRYITYAHGEKADQYRMEVPGAAAERLRASAGMLPYSTLGKQIQAAAIESLDLFAERVSG